mmetsp:Transcript_12992/g.39996  ORF Transcript_12992/g.39996 Transcript_12992/m.39996 type:complete len:346 (+) Transcript_12992:320-1357(+)
MRDGGARLRGISTNLASGDLPLRSAGVPAGKRGCVCWNPFFLQLCQLAFLPRANVPLRQVFRGGRNLLFTERLDQRRQGILFYDCPSRQKLIKLVCISPCYIRDTAPVESDDVVQLFAPAALVEKRLVQYILTRVCVNPALVCTGPYLRPDVVSPVQNETGGNVDSTTAQSESVCPFATPTLSGLQEADGIVVSWESLLCAAPLAFVSLDSGGGKPEVVLSRGSSFAFDSFSAALWTGQSVDPAEKCMLEPSQQLACESCVWTAKLHAIPLVVGYVFVIMDFALQTFCSVLSQLLHRYHGPSSLLLLLIFVRVDAVPVGVKVLYQFLSVPEIHRPSLVILLLCPT